MRSLSNLRLKKNVLKEMGIGQQGICPEGNRSGQEKNVVEKFKELLLSKDEATKENMKNMITQTEHELTGYPSVDKPWLKYYDKALTEEDIPKCSAFRMLYERNKDYLTDTALLYFHKK